MTFLKIKKKLYNLEHPNNRLNQLKGTTPKEELNQTKLQNHRPHQGNSNKDVMLNRHDPMTIEVGEQQ